MPLSKDFFITTAQLKLRIPEKKDVMHVFSATRKPGFNDGMPWEPPATIEELYPKVQENRDAWESGHDLNFTIEDRTTVHFLGRISIRLTKDKDVWNIGFWTHPESQNRGIMTEAVEAILSFGFVKLHAKKIEACYALWNKASERVLEKNGFTFQRYIEKGFKKNGKWVEENMMEITKEKWESCADEIG